MAKSRDKNDSTMDISASQLVPGNRPPVPKQPGVNKNDVSMWIGGVVGADDFAGAKKPASRSRAPLAIGLVVLLAAAAGGGAYYMFGRASSATAITPVSDSATATPVAPGSASEVPAAVPADPAYAGPEAADAGAAAPVAVSADAVSGADPKHKATPAKKKTTKKAVKKPVVKKKSTTKRR